MNKDELLQAIDNLVFSDEIRKERDSIVSVIKKHRSNRDELTDALLNRYISQLQKVFEEDGPGYPAFRFLEPGACIEVIVTEPKLNASKKVLLKKVGKKFTIDDSGRPLARCTLTLGAIEHIAAADDYIEVGANLLECRRYPIKDRSLTWETIVDAIEVYETGLLHFYRKLGMY